MSTYEEFEGAAVLVTGATSGIGLATALAFARNGARVAIVGRNAAEGRTACERCMRAGGHAIFVNADLRAKGAGERAVDETLDRLGAIDVAVNNAGAQEARALISEQTDDAFELVFDTNLRGTFEALRAELKYMASMRKGVVVNIGSVSGIRNPIEGLALYSASKAALISLTRSAAMEFAPLGVRVNAVSPGRIVTPMMLGAGVGNEREIGAGLPLRRMGLPDEVAESILWAASSRASFVVGHNLCVDGGLLAR